MADTITQSAPTEDQTMAIVTKFVVAVLVSPRLAPILARVGIPTDPVLLSAIVMIALHKAHVIAKQTTGWTWL
jgi:hypothetical protein